MKLLWTGLLLTAAVSAQAPAVRFTLLGDRTGETEPGVYETIWKQVRAEKPAFVVSGGDSIQGLDEAAAESEWSAVRAAVTPEWWPRYFLAPGNHDVWSATSAALYERQSGHKLHYSFDQGPLHFTVLDNSRSDRLSETELRFLEADLRALPVTAKIRFVVMHRPSFLFSVMLRNTEFPLHKLARQYGVQYVIAGHLHQIANTELEGVRYLLLPSAGGHLRGSRRYEDGWFFGHIDVSVENGGAAGLKMDVHERSGNRRRVEDWGTAGLLNKP